MEILDHLSGWDFPAWIIVTLLIINIFKSPIASVLFERFPQMANSHFSSIAQDKADRREFAQQMELERLKSELLRSEQEREAQQEREGNYFEILKELVGFIKTSIMDKIDSHDQRIVQELSNINKSIDRLARKIGTDKTGDFLLNRIGDK